MTKAEIVKEIAATTGIAHSQVLEVVEQLMSVIKDTVKNGEEVTLRGFGTFAPKTRAEKTARNITKNTTIVIPAHTVPHFKASAEFKKMMI